MTSLYFCPTVREVESATHGGFDTCCAHPELHVPMPDNEATTAVSEALSDAAKERFQARETNRRLNHRAQQAESKLAAFERAVSTWRIGAERGTYVPLRSLGEIAKAVGREIPSRWELHYQRVEQAEATLAAVREYLECSDDDGIRTRGHLLGLLDRSGEPSQVGADIAAANAPFFAQSLSVTVSDLQPGAEPVVCLHEHAQQTIKTTATAYEQIQVVNTIYCPVCKNYAEQLEGQPFLAPVVLNARRCTQACTEQHTYRTGCLLAPPVVPNEQR